MIDYLHTHFQTVFYQKYRHLFDDLITHYQEVHRHYHNIRHLYECLSWFDDIKGGLHHPDLVLIALFYHDVIYDPKSSSNEQDSANKMAADLQGVLSDEKIAVIHEYILATKNHTNLLTGSHQHDLAYLLDIDLAILGSQPDRFDEYDAQIRQEYAWVNGLIYHTKRQSVLRTFYRKDRIYLTDYFYDKLENQARENLKRHLSINSYRGF